MSEKDTNYMNPFKRKADQVQSVVLDTSGIIDGRIVAIAKAGFVPQNVVVPQFVIAELQFLADHGDTHKRERARYGLDIIRELQDVRRVEVSISREKFEHIKEVDDKLVALAKQYGALLYTTDFNLNKVAQIEGVQVLNVNELAHALRPNLLPGEHVSIKLTQVGQDKTQGVGYLGDGTMVVVEKASQYVGHQVQANCTRILQTQAGKMMFATLASAPALPLKPQQEHHSKPEARPQQQQQQRQPVATTEDEQPKQHSRNRRRRGNGGQQRPNGEANQQSQQPQPKPVQTDKAKPVKQQAPRGNKPQQSAPRRQNSRRLSPEDKLLATLKEIDQ
jgi:rRNA-processing protein FCF1